MGSRIGVCCRRWAAAGVILIPLVACSAPSFGDRPGPAPTGNSSQLQPRAKQATFTVRPSAGPPATLAEDVLILTSDLGDLVGKGAISSLEYPDAHFQSAAQATPARITVTATSGDEHWVLTFAAPLGQQLEVGSYDVAERVPSNLVAGLDVRGDGRGCSLGFGSFTISAISFEPTGSLAALDAAFNQACEYPDAPALHGTLTYRAPGPSG